MTQTVETSDERLKRGRSTALQALTSSLSRYGLVIAWIVLAIFFTFAAPGRFLTSQNIGNMFGSQAVLVIVAMGLMFAVIAGEWDLSVGATLGLSLTVVGHLNGTLGLSIWLAIAAALVCGVLVGLVNAFFIVFTNVPSLIATLGMSTLLAGVTYGVSNANVSGLDRAFVDFGQSRLFEIPIPFYIGLLVAVLAWYVLKWRPLGRHLYFVGAGRDVAELSGVNVPRVRVIALVTSSTLSAFGGIVLAASLGATGPTIGPTYLLPAFAAVFLGATTILPGRLNVWGSVVAVYFLITGVTGMQLLGAASFVQQIFYGAILLAAVALSRRISKNR